MKLSYYLFPVFFSFIILAGCKKSSGDEQVTNDSDSSDRIVEKHTLYSLKSMVNGSNSLLEIYSINQAEKDGFYFDVFTEDTLAYQKKLADKFHVVNIDEPASFNTIDADTWIYFSLYDKELGTGSAMVGAVVFYLINPKTKKEIVVTYEGIDLTDIAEQNVIVGDFKTLPQVDDDIVGAFLMRKIIASPRIGCLGSSLHDWYEKFSVYTNDDEKSCFDDYYIARYNGGADGIWYKVSEREDGKVYLPLDPCDGVSITSSKWVISNDITFDMITHSDLLQIKDRYTLVNVKDGSIGYRFNYYDGDSTLRFLDIIPVVSDADDVLYSVSGPDYTATLIRDEMRAYIDSVVEGECDYPGGK